MNVEELNIILANGENIRTEYKQARDKVPGSFYDTVVSFLNREGGVIVLGADNDGRATGIDPSSVEQLKKDFDTRLFDKTRAVVRAADSTHPWIEADNMTILRDSQLYRRDPRTGEEGFILAAALIFGKDEVIGSILPAYKVDVLVRINDLDRFDDRIPP